MKQWRLERNGLFLGHFIADELRMEDSTLYAYRAGKRIGSLASGPGLSWTEAPWREASPTGEKEPKR